MTTNSIFNHVPAGYKLRDVQREALTQIERDWDQHGILVITAPTASGKSVMAMTISNWRAAVDESTAVITPQVMLQDQYVDSFPAVPCLKGMSRYDCIDEMYESCEDRHDIDGAHCATCPYLEAKAQVADKAVGIFNLYSYMMSRLKSTNLIIDEAHAMIGQLQDFYTLKVYQDEDPYPNTVRTQGDAVIWLEGYMEKLHQQWVKMGLQRDLWKDGDRKRYVGIQRKIKRYRGLVDGINRNPGHFFYEEKTEKVRGSMRRFLLIRPVTLKHVGVSIYRDARKIVLMSGTINELDVEDLGLSHYKVAYINTASPIKPENRPIIVRPVAYMSAKNLDEGCKRMATEIVSLLAEYPGKGIIHCTYAMGLIFKKLLKDEPRLLFHTKTTKQATYKKFRESTEPFVLIASGMSEGIDLEGATYTWQAITKIQFQSLGDALVQRQKVMEPKKYAWAAIKTTVQQAGRICRTPDDYGVTIVLDGAIRYLYYSNRELWPEYFSQALVWQKR